MWGYKFRPQGMWGGPWGGVKCAKWAKKSFFWKMGENDEKIMKKNEKVPDFLLEMSKTILHSQDPIRKKMKKCRGVAHGSAQKGQKPFFRLSPRFNLRKGGKWIWLWNSFYLVDIIAMAPSAMAPRENIYVIRSGGGVKGLPISRCRWCKMAKNDQKFNFQANGGTRGDNILE